MVDDEAGTASLLMPGVLWITIVIAIVLIDVGGYLVAAARAQTLADSAALAAASASHPSERTDPTRAARQVVETGGGRMESCRCRRRMPGVTVEVSVEVPGVMVPALGATRVRATASAVLTQPHPE
ncbi:MAG: Rv3654c family TadE-like protein [Nitriliruptoraceae bacterium]